MIEPMLAVPLDKVEIRNWKDWAIEEKFDGHRLIVKVEGDRHEKRVTAWTRPRKHAGAAGKTMAVRVLPRHLAIAFATLPCGTYDGELLGGETSTDVTRTDLQEQLRFVIFDVLSIQIAGGLMPGTDQLTAGTIHAGNLPYDKRREVLEMIFGRFAPEGIDLAESVCLESKDDVETFVRPIWNRGGEGAMLKRRTAIYQPGKRSKDVVKIKKLQTEVMEVIGFAPGKGEKVDRGPFAMVMLRSLDGKRFTSVKTLDDAELAAFTREAMIDGRLPDNPTQDHPAIGRRLRIEFQDWTPKGGYRHPRWDRWENE